MHRVMSTSSKFLLKPVLGAVLNLQQDESVLKQHPGSMENTMHEILYKNKETLLLNSLFIHIYTTKL